MGRGPCFPPTKVTLMQTRGEYEGHVGHLHMQEGSLRKLYWRLHAKNSCLRSKNRFCHASQAPACVQKLRPIVRTVSISGYAMTSLLHHLGAQRWHNFSARGFSSQAPPP